MSFFFTTFARRNEKLAMTKQKIFISSVQGEFQNERTQIADYIRHDALLSFYFEPFLFEELPAQDRSAQAAYSYDPLASCRARD